MTFWDDLRAGHVTGFTGDVLAAGRSAAYASNPYRAIQQFVKWALVEEETPGRVTVASKAVYTMTRS